MSMTLLPNLDHADELVRTALKKRFGAGAGFDSRSEGPGFALAELVDDDGGSYSPGTDARHFGTVARLLMRLVYELNVHPFDHERPLGLTPKSVWVVDVVHTVTSDTRTAYLAVEVGGPPVLVPLFELSEELLHGAGTVTDTREALRGFAMQLADLVNAALPTARMLATTPAKSGAGTPS